MEIIYRAKDGKEFDDEWECEQYEKKCEFKKLPFKDFIALTYCDKKVEESDMQDWWDKTYHIFFKTEESVKCFEQAFNICKKYFGETFDEHFYNGLPEPNQWYHYDDEEEIYISDEQKIKELQDHIEEYDDILKKINQEEKTDEAEDN